MDMQDRQRHQQHELGAIMQRIIYLSIIASLLAAQPAFASSRVIRALMTAGTTAYTFPQNGVLDTFTGTNGTSPPDASWTNDYHTLVIQSNAVTGGTASAENLGHWNTVVTNANKAEVYATVTTLAGTNEADTMWLGLITTGGSGDGYVLQWTEAAGTDTVGLYKWTSGWIGAQIGSSINQEISAGDSLGLYSNGSTKRIYYKASGGSWAQLGSDFTDSTYTNANYLTLMVFGTAIRVDNFGGGSL